MFGAVIDKSSTFVIFLQCVKLYILIFQTDTSAKEEFFFLKFILKKKQNKAESSFQKKKCYYH